MPKTASKRAQARKVAQIKRAHETPLQPRVRRAPVAKRRQQPTGLGSFLKNYPWATTIAVVLLLGVGTLVAKSARLGPFAPPTPAKAFALTCTQPKTRHWSSAPQMQIDTSKQYTATIHTAKGDIVVQLDPKASPIAVNNFVFLARNNYYCGTYFWRVETPGQPSQIDGQTSPLALIQGGSVTKNGQDSQDNPGYGIQDETVNGDYTPGSVAMAKSSSPNSAGAQFFIDIGDESKYFSKTYQIFGHVTSGMNVVKQIKPQDLMNGVTITEK